ncbi:hypothetical protein [Allokutzneria sp. NRRL B-24872]|uniref:hypothetical protein n=1 Tax=Allokutzneria sp. NRRL B-24872 TaxID=1137961 RepID=UPI000A377F2A|nr:hypothetical protein [Allokutzneria sp. NRRL B-24872]
MSKQYVRVGGWRIDLDQVPAAIKIFNDALANVEKAAAKTHDHVEALPMGQDHVSVALAAEVNKRHATNPGSTRNAVKSLRDALSAVVAQLEAAKRHYRRVEDAAGQGFRRG